MFYAYVLRSLKNGRFYYGSTNNLERRLTEHNKGYKGYSKFAGPFEIIYKEEFKTRIEAYKREKFYKSGQGRELIKQKLI